MSTASLDDLFGPARYVDASAFTSGFADALRINRERFGLYRVLNTTADGTSSMRLPDNPAPWRDGPNYALVVNDPGSSGTVGVFTSSGASLALLEAGEAVVIHRVGSVSAALASGWIAVPFDLPGSASVASVSAVALPAAPVATSPPVTGLCVYYELVDVCGGGFGPRYTYTGFEDDGAVQGNLDAYIGLYVQLQLAEGASPATNDRASYLVRKRQYVGVNYDWEVLPISAIVAVAGDCERLPPPPDCTNTGSTCIPQTCAGSPLNVSACNNTIVVWPSAPAALLAIQPSGIWADRGDFEADYLEAFGAALEFCGCRDEFRNFRNGGCLECQSRRTFCYLGLEVVTPWFATGGCVPEPQIPAACPNGRLECCCVG